MPTEGVADIINDSSFFDPVEDTFRYGGAWRVLVGWYGLNRRVAGTEKANSASAQTSPRWQSSRTNALVQRLNSLIF